MHGDLLFTKRFHLYLNIDRKRKTSDNKWK